MIFIGRFGGKSIGGGESGPWGAQHLDFFFHLCFRFGTFLGWERETSHLDADSYWVGLFLGHPVVVFDPLQFLLSALIR